MVRLGEPFEVMLMDVNPDTISWKADFDPVLKIDVKAGGLSATIEATAGGPSELQFQIDRKAVRWVNFEVFNPEAVSLDHPKAPVIEPLT